jgi:hypothetical protein
MCWADHAQPLESNQMCWADHAQPLESNQMCCASWVMYEVIKEHDSGLEHHQRALGQN